MQSVPINGVEERFGPRGVRSSGAPSTLGFGVLASDGRENTRASFTVVTMPAFGRENAWLSHSTGCPATAAVDVRPVARLYGGTGSKMYTAKQGG